MQKLAVYTLGFLQVPYIRKMLRISGWKVSAGPLAFGAAAVGVWGRKPLAKRGIKAADRRGLPLLSIEDAFLRSVLPGPKSAPSGLILDEVGIFFDARQPSRLENILNFEALDDEALLARAQDGINFLRHAGLSKYNPVPRGRASGLTPGYVLVVDQTRGDASITCGGAFDHTFATMLAKARADHPEKQIVIRTHPAVGPRAKQGHFEVSDLDSRTTFLSKKINPWDLLEGASEVYCVTSQLGFEAILAGHKPVVFGMPFYAGWGLTTDQQKCKRRKRALTVKQLFAAAMLRYPAWVDLSSNRACSFEEAATALLARAKLHWLNETPTVAVGMRNWKRPQMARFLGKPRFENDPVKAARIAAAQTGRVVVWASQNSFELQTACANENVPLWQMEDGFLRSRGLGAALTPAESVVVDDLGIYFNPLGPSRLEALIEASVDLPDVALKRAKALVEMTTRAKLSKYNLSLPAPRLNIPAGQRVILVPGQVEDDASIRYGAGEVCTNQGLLAAVRAANPEAYIIYKPHPDVEAGLRVGVVENALECADLVADNAAILPLVEAADEIWTITSLTGFEALLRGKRVTCLGLPFYAGWGLTQDLGPSSTRRSTKPDLAALAHATLIDYPLNLDPKTGKPCAPELLIERLEAGAGKRRWRLKV
ncbi:MAG: capsular polysaccharide biosynthesis protein, partial [Rhodobacteraceae bacterium]|nr:capsular polysaccharide biosynthesis protein [Paracoccaceae bacterium]